MNTLAAVIITFNEEINIERCLKSLQNVVDEIVIVDSFSTDATKSICEKYKTTFVERKWEGYSKTKNFANSLVNSEYILSLDADEVLSNQLQQSILQLKLNNKKNDHCWMVTRLTNYCGKWIKHCGWYPDKKVRIWKKDMAYWQGDVHEQLVFEKTVHTELLSGDLFHYSFNSIEQHLNTINKYSTIAAEAKFKKGKKTNLLRILFKPLSKFIIAYFLKLGFLDGFYGFVVCKNSAYSTFLKEIKLKQLKS